MSIARTGLSRLAFEEGISFYDIRSNSRAVEIHELDVVQKKTSPKKPNHLLYSDYTALDLFENIEEAYYELVQLDQYRLPKAKSIYNKFKEKSLDLQGITSLSEAKKLYNDLSIQVESLHDLITNIDYLRQLCQPDTKFDQDEHEITIQELAFQLSEAFSEEQAIKQTTCFSECFFYFTARQPTSKHRIANQLTQLVKIKDAKTFKQKALPLIRDKGEISTLYAEAESKIRDLEPKVTSLSIIHEFFVAKSEYEHVLQKKSHLQNVIEKMKKNEELLTTTTKRLIDTYNSLWREHKQAFDPIPFDRSQFIHILEKHNNAFVIRQNETTQAGIVEKKVVKKSTDVFVRADLHGDLKSLLQNLLSLQSTGHLDERFHCNENTHLIFLGDYGDRGAYSMQVFEILMMLRLENPTKVTLIRGNHENTLMNAVFHGFDSNLYEFTNDSVTSSSLDTFYKSMPLSLFLAEESDTDQHQFVLFAHGLFDLHFDAHPLLNNSHKEGFIGVEKLSSIYTRSITYLLSPRVRSINFDPYSDYEALLNMKMEKEDRKKLKLEMASQKIHELATRDIRNPTIANMNGFCWADINFHDDTSYIQSLDQRKYKICLRDIKNYFRLISTEFAKVKMIVRGHEHKHTLHYHNGKIVAITMPVGMDGPIKDRYPGQQDTFYLFTTSTKVKDWTKRLIFRNSGSSKCSISDACNIHETSTYS